MLFDAMRSLFARQPGLTSEVLEDGGEIDGRSSTDTFCVATLAEVAGDTTYRELKSGLFSLFVTFSFSLHSGVDHARWSLKQLTLADLEILLPSLLPRPPLPLPLPAMLI